MIEVITDFLSQAIYGTVALSYDTSLWWTPIVLLVAFCRTWIYYARANNILKMKTTLLEVRLPKETYKSPLAMEVVLNALYQTGREGTWYKKYVLGKMRPWFSLEFISIEGKVRFFVWTELEFKDLIESSIYSQYPSVEVHEVPDYTRVMPYGRQRSKWDLYGTEFDLTKPDAYPIKTYVDYGLDRDPKEEFKIDPLSTLLEFLGYFKKDEQVWIQIIVRATKSSNKQPGGLWGHPYDWRKEGQVLADGLRKKYAKQEPKPGQTFAFDRILTKGQQDEIAAIERSVAKYGFDAGIRAIYFAQGDAFRASNISGLLGVFKQFGSNELNGFKPARDTSYDHPWSDVLSMSGTMARLKNLFIPGTPLIKDVGLAEKKATIFNAYIRRAYFHPPYSRRPFVLNSEELATLYHFPGGTAQAPTMERMESKKAEPPMNLPF